MEANLSQPVKVWLLLILVLILGNHLVQGFSLFRRIKSHKGMKISMGNADLYVESPFSDIIPFLSEHIQESDQMLVLGTSTDLCLQLAKDGYGREKTGFMKVIDDDKDRIEYYQQLASDDEELAELMKANKLSFKHVDFTNMGEVCQQSVFDAIVDNGAIDSLILSRDNAGNEKTLSCIDQLQNAVRLGNILICISKLEKDIFCPPFEERFGWVQELDGDPGELSAWYRDGKSNIEATKSNFKELGLKMYVYTNTDNC